jgi:uncharacterized membrane protein YhaH (DUF805 family)
MATKKTNNGTAGSTAERKSKTSKSEEKKGGIGGFLESCSQKLAGWRKRAGNSGIELFIIELLENFLAVINKYKVAEGRARRREFWMFVLLNFIVGIVFSILGIIPIVNIFTWLASTLFAIAIFIPQLMVGVRRLHDTNKTAWFMLLLIIPIVGWIILIVFWALEGNSGSNNYGPDPKGGRK